MGAENCESFLACDCVFLCMPNTLHVRTITVSAFSKSKHGGILYTYDIRVLLDTRLRQAICVDMCLQTICLIPYL